MIDKKIQKAINEQINAEMYSAYLYLSMAAYFDHNNLKGFSSWMRVQAMEELTHAKRFYAFLVDRGGRVKLAAIDTPPAEWNNPLDVFTEAAKHEQKVTKLINGLVDMAIELHDHAANTFLQWFVNEQVEEEASVEEVIQSLKLVDNQASGWFLIDKDLAARTFIPPIGVTI
ncbi:MAG: ferritin [Candidatus Margulisbacteria bacterium]|nr:ferritin [Candidatus Margulisiibacteriota bacterium]